MKKRVLIVVMTLLLVAAGFTVAQPQNLAPYFPDRPGSAPSPPSDHNNPAQVLPVPSTAHAPQMAKEAKPEDLTIDQLIDEVSKIREEKAKLAKKEDLYVKTLTSKAATQKERIDSLLGVPKATTDDPARIPSANIPIPGRGSPSK